MWPHRCHGGRDKQRKDLSSSGLNFLLCQTWCETGVCYALGLENLVAGIHSFALCLHYFSSPLRRRVAFVCCRRWAVKNARSGRPLLGRDLSSRKDSSCTGRPDATEQLPLSSPWNAAATPRQIGPAHRCRRLRQRGVRAVCGHHPSAGGHQLPSVSARRLLPARRAGPEPQRAQDNDSAPQGPRCPGVHRDAARTQLGVKLGLQRRGASGIATSHELNVECARVLEPRRLSRDGGDYRWIYQIFSN
ncbi:uncharacterized protein LOC144134214 [Amblyomma americanum]